MCLAVPLRITHIGAHGQARGEVGGVVRDVDLSLVDDVAVGDYVIVHVGFALSRLDPDEAAETLKLFAEAGVLDAAAVPGGGEGRR